MLESLKQVKSIIISLHLLNQSSIIDNFLHCLKVIDSYKSLDCIAIEILISRSRLTSHSAVSIYKTLENKKKFSIFQLFFTIEVKKYEDYFVISKIHCSFLRYMLWDVRISMHTNSKIFIYSILWNRYCLLNHNC